jgi:hypothetical protein
LGTDHASLGPAHGGFGGGHAGGGGEALFRKLLCGVEVDLRLRQTRLRFGQARGGLIHAGLGLWHLGARLGHAGARLGKARLCFCKGRAARAGVKFAQHLAFLDECALSQRVRDHLPGGLSPDFDLPVGFGLAAHDHGAVNLTGLAFHGDHAHGLGRRRRGLGVILGCGLDHGFGRFGPRDHGKKPLTLKHKRIDGHGNHDGGDDREKAHGTTFCSRCGAGCDAANVMTGFRAFSQG